jgi:uncharacterized radical SAM superfamily protein
MKEAKEIRHGAVTGTVCHYTCQKCGQVVAAKGLEGWFSTEMSVKSVWRAGNE